MCQCGVCVHACVSMCACVCMKVHKFPRITYYTSCMLQDVRICSHVHACLSVCLSVCPSASDSPERSVQHSALRCQRECVQYKQATETAEGAAGIPHLTSPHQLQSVNHANNALTSFIFFSSNPQMRKRTFAQTTSKSVGHSSFAKNCMRSSLGRNSPSPKMSRITWKFK